MLARTRFLVAILVLALAVLPLAGCGSDSEKTAGGDGGGSDAAGENEAAEPAITPQNADELTAYLQDTYGSEEWMSTFTGAEFTTALSRPVIRIAFQGTRDDVTIFEDDVLDLFYGGEIAVDSVVEVWSDEGWAGASSFGTQPELGPLPATPANEGEVIGYLQAAYGPDGTRPTDERWVAALQSASIEVNNDGLRVLTVATGLESVSDAKDSAQATLIVDALNEADISGWADRIDVGFASGFLTTMTTADWTSHYDW